MKATIIGLAEQQQERPARRLAGMSPNAVPAGWQVSCLECVGAAVVPCSAPLGCEKFSDIGRGSSRKGRPGQGRTAPASGTKGPAQAGYRWASTNQTCPGAKVTGCPPAVVNVVPPLALGRDTGVMMLFFGPDAERPAERRIRERKAKVICALCPLRAECLEYALRHPARHGIWGGLSPEELGAERRRLVRRVALRIGSFGPGGVSAAGRR
jgi:WhiB family redox-sensing transcriptional regulator